MRKPRYNAMAKAREELFRSVGKKHFVSVTPYKDKRAGVVITKKGDEQ